MNTSCLHATRPQDIAGFEASMSFDTPLTSSVMPRWQRKQLQQQQQQQLQQQKQQLQAENGMPMGPSSCATSNSSLSSSGNGCGETRDRFIPSRSSMCMDRSNYLMSKENDRSAAAGGSGDGTPTAALAGSNRKSDFNKVLESNLLGAPAPGQDGYRVLAFQKKAPAQEDSYQNGLRVLYSQSKARLGGASGRSIRHIPSAPVRILDAPDLVDDYYVNLLSWGSNNVLAVALGQSVYLWNAKSGDITELMSLSDEDFVSSVAWTKSGTHLAVGTAGGETQFWDTATGSRLRTMNGHSARVGALAWNEHIVTSGSRDTTAVHHDLRAQRHAVGTLRGHTQEVCGLSWSPDGSMLASGSNDNTCCLWDASVGQGRFSTAAPRFTLTDHQAAVKALAWCPFERNTLASGGGTADRCIKLWNAQTGSLINSVDTGSQVLSLLWSHTEKELLSSHGYPEHQLCLWKYPSMVKVKELTGHTQRVLYMAASPDGRTVVSGAGDETLRFWDVFAPPVKSEGSG
ncbi:unnamed protein product, partial [Ascophyllum nodosum]